MPETTFNQLLVNKPINSYMFEFSSIKYESIQQYIFAHIAGNQYKHTHTHSWNENQPSMDFWAFRSQPQHTNILFHETIWLRSIQLRVWIDIYIYIQSLPHHTLCFILCVCVCVCNSLCQSFARSNTQNRLKLTRL